MNTLLKKITLFAFSIMFAFGGTFAPLSVAFADAPTVPTNGAPHNATEPDNEFDFTWDASTGDSDISYEFQSSQNPAESGGVLTTGVWQSGTLTTNSIHSSGAADGDWYWQVRAIDADNVQSAWSPIWKVTIDSTPEPVDEAEITNLDAYYKVDTYKGIGLDISVDNLTDATGVEVRTTRSNGADVVKTSKDTGSVLGLLNTGDAATVTAPIVIQQGDYDEAGSSSWNQPLESWDETTVPETITVTITRSAGDDLVKTININEVGESFGTLDDVMPVPVVQLAVTNETTGETFATLQEAIDDADTVDGNSLKINENLTVTSQVNVTKALNIRGIGHTISADFEKTSNSNNAVFGIIGTDGVTLRGMTIDGTNGVNLHGVNVYESTGILLRNINTKNHDHSGVSINSSSVTLDNITTSGNGWHGVNADQRTSLPTVLTVKGVSTHTGELADIYVDNTSLDVTVNDTNDQYDIFTDVKQTGDAVYKLKVVLPPEVTVEVTASNTEGWIPYTQTGGMIDFADDTTTSFGDGALDMKTADDNDSVAAYYREVNVDLADVYALGYNTKQLQGPEGSANPSYYLGIDKDGDLNTSDVSYALYETYYNGTNIAGDWQAWEMDDSKGFFWSSAPVGSKGSNPGGSYADNFTLGELKAAYPNAVVVEYGLNMGTSNPDWESLVDGFKFNETTYDFEPTDVDTAPTIPASIFPNDNQVLNSNNLYVDWEASTDDTTTEENIRYEYRLFLENPEINPSAPIRYQKDYTGTTRHPAVGFATGTPEDTYFWRIRACDEADNCSGWSPVREFTIDDTAPTAPEIITPTNEQLFTTTPILNDWTDSLDNNGVDHYQIEYVYDDGHTFSGAPYRETTVSQRNHTPSLSEQGGVTIRVRAFDAAGNVSDWSNSVHYIYDTEPTPNTAPTLTLNGEATMTLTVGDTFTDPGATANDAEDGDISSDIIVGGDVVDTSTAGVYVVTYNVTDSGGISAPEMTLTVTVNEGFDTDNVPALDGNPSARSSSRRAGFSTSGTTGGQVLGAESYNFTLLLKRGSRGTEVMELQKFLNAGGYNSGLEDGIFGPITEAAVKAFQRANGLVADGIVGPLTRAVLNA